MPISAILCSRASHHLLALAPYMAAIQVICLRLFAFVSLHSLSWVTLCKMIAITNPFIYERHLYCGRCYFIIATIWFVGFLVAGAVIPLDTRWYPAICMARTVVDTPQASLIMLLFMIGITIPVVVIAYATTRIVYVIVRTHQRIAAQAQSIGCDHGSSGHTASVTVQSIRSARNVLIVCASVTVLVTPSIAYGILFSMSGDKDMSHWLQFALMWFASCDTVSHSLLFLFFTPSFRRRTRKMLEGLFETCRRR